MYYVTVIITACGIGWGLSLAVAGIAWGLIQIHRSASDF